MVGRSVALVLTGLLVLALTPAQATAFPAKFTPNGQLDFTYGAAVDSAGGPSTGFKPENKLFYTGDGSSEAVRWWAVLGTSGPSPAAGAYLWELVNHAWVPRIQLPGADPWAKADTLFEGGTLYVSTRDAKSSKTGNPRESDLYEIPYQGNGSWGSVSGPFPITTSGLETLTIARDGIGRIWATFESSKTIRVGYTAPGGTSFTFMTISQTRVNGDDDSAVTAFGGDKIGVFWSDQVAKKDFFAWRYDSDPTSSWTIETAYGGGVGGCPTLNSDLCADDHMNLKVYQGEVYVAIKTSLNDVSGGPNDPQVALLRRGTTGTWSAFPVSPVSQGGTRPITVLSPEQNAIWVWAARNGEIDVWESSFTSPGFNSSGYVPWIRTSGGLDDPTSTRQVTTAASGVVVEASISSASQYWHNEFLPAGTAPTSISGFTPDSGPVGTSVTITGSGFTAATDVTFNGTSAGSGNFTVDSDLQITATVPSGATTGPIAVTAPGGTGTSSTNFTVIPPPSISSFSPTSGPIGTSVTITGSGFTGASDVTFNGTSAGSGNFTVDSDLQITATVPSGATTGPIAVTAPGGTATSSTDFTVSAPDPTSISGFTPDSGPVGTSVTITGSGFTGASDVTFNGTSAGSGNFTVDSGLQITATVPSGATTGPIAVTAPGGTATSSTSFTVTSSPTISEVQKEHASTSDLSISATLASAPTPGNVLVAVVVVSQASSPAFDTPAGWTAPFTPARGAVFWKVSDGTEQTVTVNLTAGQTAKALRMWVVELSGADTTNPFDQGGSAIFGSTVTSVTATTAGPTAQASEWTIAMVGHNGSNGGGETVTDGFTLLAAGYGRDIGASKVLTSTGAVSTTFSWTTARTGCWIIATFRAAGG